MIAATLGKVWARPCVRPAAFLRWAGSKKQLVDVLRAYWSPTFKRYVEPFAGSSRLYFAIEPESALLADKNAGLIEAYDVLKSEPLILYRAISALPTDEESYYRIRAKIPNRKLERAARFIYLNRFCFNGIFRTNRKGEFNVPYGQTKRKKGCIPPLEQFLACSRLLQGADVRAWDFGTTLRHVRAGDFVYLDPPYAADGPRIFKEYSQKPFSLDDLDRLSEHLNKISRRGASFVLSYVDLPQAREAFSKWNVRPIVVRRHVAGFTGARRVANELLVTNLEQ
ncbi:MAG: DNA adenine methylase [Tepidisphaeraceae bacterium]